MTFDEAVAQAEKELAEAEKLFRVFEKRLRIAPNFAEIIERLRSPHADKIFVAKDYTKAQLIADLEFAASMRGLSGE